MVHSQGIRLFLPLFLAAAATAIPIHSLKADNTLIYGEVGEEGKVLSAQRLYLRENALALETFGESRVVMFNREANSLKIVDHENHRFFKLDAETVEALAEKLAVTEREFLEGLEAKTAQMSKEDRKKIQPVLDQLHEASDERLKKSPETVFTETGQTETVEDMETVVIDAHKGGKLAARYYLVAYETLGLSRGENETLEAFVNFIQEISKSVPGKLRDQFGDIDLLIVSKRIPVQVIHQPGSDSEKKHVLLNRFGREISEEWFVVPEEYREETFARPPQLPDFGRQLLE